MPRLPVLEEDAADPEMNSALILIDKGRYGEAVFFLEAAERRDVSSAQYILGQMYASGNGVQEDAGKAVRMFMKASDNGNPYADSDLGVCYYEGFGVEKDIGKAFEYFSRAAESGVPEAELCLGNMYASGEGTDKDPVKALEWFKKSANKGNADAQFNVGIAYELGVGTEKDIEAAKRWFRLAADQGDAAAKKKLKQLGRCDRTYKRIVKGNGAPDGIRTRVEASRGLHDWPLHYRSSNSAYLGIIYNRFVAPGPYRRNSTGSNPDS